MKAYFCGLGMEGTAEIKEKRSIVYMALPNRLEMGMVETGEYSFPKPESAFSKAEFRYVGMMPVYEMESIS